MFGISWNYMATDHPGGLTRDHVVWAYRLLLDRDPENEDVIGPKLAGSRDTRELRHHLMTSAEFQDKNRDYAHTNDRTIVIKELDGPGSARLFVDLSDHVIGLSILRGHYESAEIAFVRQNAATGRHRHRRRRTYRLLHDADGPLVGHGPCRMRSNQLQRTPTAEDRRR